MTTYTLFKRKVATSGPWHQPMESFTRFRECWQHALGEFNTMGATIVGCHLDDNPSHPKSAEFFIVIPGNMMDLPAIHETYVILGDDV